MTEAQVLDLINLYIVANGNNEITADVLRPVLIAMLEQPNDKVGELSNLATTDQTDIVSAINELYNSLGSSGFTIHTGTSDPNVTPPGTFSIGDWYIRNGGTLYQFNGTEWIIALGEAPVDGTTYGRLNAAWVEVLNSGGYSGTAQDIIDLINEINTTTAGILSTVYFTGDEVTLSSGTYFLSSITGKGSEAQASPTTLSVADNTKLYFDQDVISQPFVSETLASSGTYNAILSVLTAPNEEQQRYTIEIYRTDINGDVLPSLVTGAAVGDLGTTLVAILDSGLLTLPNGAVTPIGLTGELTEDLTFNIDERLRYHVSAAKIGTQGGNLDMDVFYGYDYSSRYTVPVQATSDTVINVSTVSGNTVSDALDFLLSNSVPVTDGDKGDVTVSGTGSIWSLNNESVSEATLDIALQDKINGAYEQDNMTEPTTTVTTLEVGDNVIMYNDVDDEWVMISRDDLLTYFDGIYVTITNFLQEKLSGTTIFASDVSGTYNIDWNAGSVWDINCNGNTTLADTNLPISGTNKVINIYMDFDNGTEVVTLPGYWVKDPDSDDLDATQRVRLTVEAINNTSDVTYYVKNLG